MKNVLAQVRTIRRAYRLLGRPDHVRHDVFDGAHRWNGVEAVPWLRRHLLGEWGDAAPRPTAPERAV